MPSNKTILVLIFLLALSSRLFFAFQTPFLDNGAYPVLRQVEHIEDTGFPMAYDELSFSGRSLITLPVYYYILAFFNLFLPLEIVAKIIPNVFASLLILVVYKLTFHLTKNKSAALMASFISAFIPVFFELTVNSASPVSFAAPLFFLTIYYLLKTKEHKKYLYYTVFSVIVLTLSHPLSLFLIFVILAYFVFVKAEGLQFTKEETEVFLFSAFLLVWLVFLIYKKVFLVHGPSLFIKTAGFKILEFSFYKVSILTAVYKIGFISFITGLFIIYTYVFRKKSKNALMLIGFALILAFTYWLNLADANIVLVFLGIIFTVFFGMFYKSLLAFVEKTLFSRHMVLFTFIIIIIFFFTSIIPSFYYAEQVAGSVISQSELDALYFLKDNAGQEDIILSTIEESPLITYFSQRKTVLGYDFLLVKDAPKRVEDVRRIFTTPYETDAIELLNEYDVRYIFFSDFARSFYSVDSLSYTEDAKCFELVYNDSIQIYKSRCVISEK